MNTSWKDGERQVCKMLEGLWGVKFFRSEGSGALATSRQKTLPKSVVDALTGDVICDPQDPLLDPKIGWPFSVEVKTRHSEIDVFGICRNGKDSELGKWWDQCCRDAMRVGKLPLMFMKKVGGHGWYVALDTMFFGLCCVEKTEETMVIENKSWSAKFLIAVEEKTSSWLEMTVMDSKDFLGFGRKQIEEATRNFGIFKSSIVHKRFP